jgi:hypothetical protein
MSLHVGLAGEDEDLERLGIRERREDAEQGCGHDDVSFHSFLVLAYTEILAARAKK